MNDTQQQRSTRSSVQPDEQSQWTTRTVRYLRQSVAGSSAPNDVLNAEHNQHITCHSMDVNQPAHWPSHGRICPTLTETDANRRAKYGRGVLKGFKVGKKRLERSAEKLAIEFSSRLGGTVGINYRSFVDDVVMFMKKHVPLVGVRKWSDVDKTAQSSIFADMLDRWRHT